MVNLLVHFQQQVSAPRWIVVGILAVLFVQSLFLPIELLHTHGFAIASVWGCLAFLVRDSDVFVMKLLCPTPLLILLILLKPFIRAWKSRRSLAG